MQQLLTFAPVVSASLTGPIASFLFGVMSPEKVVLQEH